MKNTLFRWIKKAINRNPYKKEIVPYNIGAAKKYAASVGKRLTQLTEEEMNRFVLPKTLW